jgi:hypothetical protein
MRKIFTILFTLLLVVLSVSCSGPAINEPPAPTPDTQATVDAAIAGTATAQVEFETQVEQAVEATVTAMPTEEEVLPPPAEEYATYSEEELATEVDSAVDEAVIAYDEAENTINEAAEDGTITQEEYDEIDLYIDDLYYALELADELIYAYYGYYGELAEDTLYLLEEIEGDLDELYTFADDVVDILVDVEAALDTGIEVAQETINQLIETGEVAQARRDELIDTAPTWIAGLQTEIEGRVTDLQSIAPSEIPANRADALLATFDYVDAVRAALLDQKINLQELANIAQLGANAMAGLESFGGPQMKNLSGNIGDITSQLAGGQVPQALSGLGSLEGALGARPK